MHCKEQRREEQWGDSVVFLLLCVPNYYTTSHEVAPWCYLHQQSASDWSLSIIRSQDSRKTGLNKSHHPTALCSVSSILLFDKRMLCFLLCANFLRAGFFCQAAEQHAMAYQYLLFSALITRERVWACRFLRITLCNETHLISIYYVTTFNYGATPSGPTDRPLN